MKRWDIFCKIVDNFGDIGVSWRLARQLQAEHDLEIRLWIDDLAAAQKIIPSLNIAKNSQVCDEITILKWPGIENASQADFSQVADVVIEAFACELPPAYLMAMVRQQSKWVNLEYLSAENWVDDFHAKPSPQNLLNLNHGLTRYFYFPGFTEATGGLIREAHIAALLQSHNNPRPQAGEGARQRGRGAVYGNLDAAPLSNLSPASGREAIKAGELETSIPVRPSHFSSQFTGLENWGRPLRSEPVEGQEALKISLFCYLNAPIKDLFTALQPNIHAASVYVPESSILPQIADYFGVETIGVGDYFTRENLHVHILPFLSQTDYDALLRDCDLNFVRGEDSWVRAIWAAKPFIWLPYFQDENTHIKKLNAFLDLFYANIKIQIPTQTSFPPPIKSLEGRLQRESSPLTKNKMDSRLRGNDGVEENIVFNSVANIHRAWLSGNITNAIWQNYLDHLATIKDHTLQQTTQLSNQTDLAAKLVIFCNKIPNNESN